MNKTRNDSFNVSSHAVDGDLTEAFQVPKEEIVKATAYATIMLLSLCGNTLVLVAVKRNIGGGMHSARNYLLTSLAVIDLVTTVGSIPERLTRTLTNDVWLIEGAMGVAFCKATNFFEKFSFNVSTLTVVLIAVDRFLAVMFPHQKYFTKRRAFAAIGLIWLLSAFYWSPILYYGSLLQEDGKTLCKVRRFFTKWKTWYLLFLVQLLFSLVLVVILYASICLKLWRHAQNKIGARSSLNSNRSARDLKISRKVVKMVAVIIIAFYICFLPYWVGWVFCFYSEFVCNDTYVSVAIFLPYANSSFNPFIYCIFSESFRRAFQQVIQETCRCVVCSRGTEADLGLPPPGMPINKLVEMSVLSIEETEGQNGIEPRERSRKK